MTRIERKVLGQLRKENRELSESQTFLRRILAAIADNAGGEIIVSDLALVKTAINPTILTWTDEQLRFHVKVRPVEHLTSWQCAPK